MLFRSPLLGIYPEKTIIQKESCSTVFTATLFTIARTWKQPSVHRQMNGKRRCGTYIQWNITQPLKGNEIELFVVRWMDLVSVIQSEISQKEKNKYHMLTHIYGI